MINVQFVAKSRNSKMGAIPCTTSDRKTCPKACPLKESGACYAQAGYYTRLNWDKVDKGERGGNWSALVEKIAGLKPGQVWRHNVAGDLPHIKETIDTEKLGQLMAANVGKKGFTYTHHDMTKPQNRKAVKTANQFGFAINMSANSLDHADHLKGLKIGPVVAIVPEDKKANFFTKAGNKVLICPATVRDGVTCASCKLCARANRETIIGFPAHGSGKSKIDFGD